MSVCKTWICLLVNNETELTNFYGEHSELNKSIFGSTQQRNTVNLRIYQALHASGKSIRSIDALFAVGIFSLRLYSKWIFYGLASVHFNLRKFLVIHKYPC